MHVKYFNDLSSFKDGCFEKKSFDNDNLLKEEFFVIIYFSSRNSIRRNFRKKLLLLECQLLHFVFVETESTILNYKRPIPLSIFEQLENSLTLSSCSESHYRSKLSLDHRSFSTSFQTCSIFVLIMLFQLINDNY